MSLLKNPPHQKIEESYYSCHCACTMTVLATNGGQDQTDMTEEVIVYLLKMPDFSY